MTIEEIKNVIDYKRDEIKKLEYEINNLNKQLASSLDNKVLSGLEKLNIFMNYFKGRYDVYAKSTIYNNKIIYYPACKYDGVVGACNKKITGTCNGCINRSLAPLTKDVIYRHISKGDSIGIYPILKDNTCYFLVLDFDDKNLTKYLKGDVSAFCSTCDKYNVPIVLERSRSGNGIHIWIFFSNKLSATVVRRLGNLLIKRTKSDYNIELSSFDRMFPNQDTIKEGGFGNLIALPYHGDCVKLGNTVFIDRNFTRIRNAMNYLNTIHKLSETEVNELINRLVADNKDILDKENIVMYPSKISIILKDMIYIDKNNLNKSAINSFRRLARFHNPEYYKKEKLRLSTYNVPRIIDCSKEDDNYLKIPRGLLEKLELLCNDNHISIYKVDKRNIGIKIDVEFKGELYDYQEESLVKLLTHDNGILCGSTSFGKTVVACKIIAQRNTNTLVVVNKLKLLNQWKERLKEFLTIDEVGEYSSKKKKLTNIVDVVSIRSLWNNGNVLDFVKNYGMIIVDECHHTASVTHEQVINFGSARYVYGLSATPKSSKGHTPIITMQCGPIRYKINNKEFNKKLGIPMQVIVRHTKVQLDNSVDSYKRNEIFNLIVKDIDRTNNIIEDIKKEYSNKKNILVLTDRLEHLDYIYQELSKFTNNIFKYQGNMKKKLLDEYKELNYYINSSNENKIIVATSSCIGEGYDDPCLDTLFLTMPTGNENLITQYVGRLHRQFNTKEVITVYDYVDDNLSKTRNMYSKRKRIYNKLGYEIIDGVIQERLDI